MSKYHPKNLLTQEPVALGGGVTVLFQLAVLLGVITLTAEQTAGITVAVVTVLTLLTRRRVRPTANDTDGDGEPDDFADVIELRP